MTASDTPFLGSHGSRRPSIEEVFAGVEPIRSADDLARGSIFDDDELGEFLADLRALRCRREGPVEMSAAANIGAGDLERHVPIEELMARQGIGPVASVEDLAEEGAFESDEELEEFLVDLYASRRANVG